MGTSADAAQPITSLAAHIPKMEAFHRRYMVSNKLLRLWANMARTLPIHMIVPQHGAPLAGPAVKEFIDWIGTVDCGVDHLTQANYTVPQ
jgi:flavorubredoxin